MKKDLEPVPAGDYYEAATTFDSSLTSAVEAAVKAMPWITDMDRGAVTLARAYAAQIDRVLTDKMIRETDPQLITKALYLGPHLLNTLRELGGTPAGRGVQMTKKEALDPVEEELAGLRSRVNAATRGKVA